jgi:peptidoglycan/LPS O-acetylase OafA/YrhL
MNNSTVTQPHRFAVLDGMRGLAAFAVIADHVPTTTIGPLIPGRYLAVDFFFVLSGFVLTHAYGRPLATGSSALAFMKARAIRLYPLYLAGLGLGAMMTLIHMARGSEVDPAKVAMTLAFNALFLPSPPFVSENPSLFPFDGPAWSLFFELAVNIVFAVLAAQLFGLRIWALLLLAGVFLTISAISLGMLDGGFVWPNVSLGAARVTYSFFAGVAVYRFWAWRTLPALRPWLAFTMLALVFAVPASGPWRAIFDLFAALVIFPVLVALSANATTSRLGKRIYLFIGMLSYGIYVLHEPMFRFIRAACTAIHIKMESLGDGTYFLVLFASAATALLANKFYDLPLRRWLSRQRPANIF